MTLVIRFAACIMTGVIVKTRSQISADGGFRDDGQCVSSSGTSAAGAKGAQRSAAHPAQGCVGDRDERDRDRGGRAPRIAPALLPRRQGGDRLRRLALGGRR